MAPDAAPLLELRDWTLLQRRAGGAVPLLTGLDLTLRPGQWLAVAGANGSGKSSLLAYLAGPDSPLGVPAAFLPQEPDDQFVAGTVAGELSLGRPGPVAAPSGFGLESVLAVDPRLLSAGQIQRLALALALGLGPRVLLCDEPTSLQDEEQSVWVLDRLDAWRHEEKGCLVTATCDRREAQRADVLLVLDAGRVVACGEPGEVLAGEWGRLFGDGAAAGGASGHHATPSPAASAVPVLSLRGVTCRFGAGEGISGIDLELRAGDRLGLCGPNGCGKSTLLAMCAGARRPDEGAVALCGRRLYRRGDRDTTHGLAMLAPQFPEYLFSRSSVARELAVDPAFAGRDAEAFAAELGLPPGSASRHPRDLSCGQRRRLALGLVLRSGRPLLLVDEPTVGLDADGRALARRLLEAAPPEAAVVVASHDHRLLDALGCEVRRLENGRLAPVTGTVSDTRP